VEPNKPQFISAKRLAFSNRALRERPVAPEAASTNNRRGRIYIVSPMSETEHEGGISESMLFGKPLHTLR
jgi:hypothetical protein